MNDEPEVGDLIYERGEKATDDSWASARVLRIVEIREPGFYVVKPPESSEPGAFDYAVMMTGQPIGGMLKLPESVVTTEFTPVKGYEADAWVQLEGDSPQRLRIGLLKRHEVKR
jgi:hypothetical protein